MTSFPDSIYSPRAKENRNGVVYDATKKSVIFKEDISKLDDEVVATETELGTNPKGAYASVKAFLADLLSKVISAFTDIPDVPASYADQGGKAVAVKATEDGLEFKDFPAGGGGLGYALMFGCTARTPDKSADYYWGGFFGRLSTVAGGLNRVYIPKAGTIKAADAYFWNSTSGTAETSTIYIRKNNTTDIQISNAVVNNAASTVASNVALSTSVVAGDYLEIHWTTPAWVTVPTSVHHCVIVYIE